LKIQVSLDNFAINQTFRYLHSSWFWGISHDCDSGLLLNVTVYDLDYTVIPTRHYILRNHRFGYFEIEFDHLARGYVTITTV
jgi:hypothetical protein